MKRVKRIGWTALSGGLLLVFACVTINIYFPAEKVESVAAEIVDDIRGEGKAKEKGLKDSKNSGFIKALWALAPATAWAQEVTAVSNPTIRALKNQMKDRYTQLSPYYQKGVLKEEPSGYVSLVNTGGLGLKEKRDLKNLVDAENRDREKLYEEVARALKIDLSQTERIAKIFAKEWQKSLR